ncbi:MAG: transposase [Methylococcaceae bacterium]|nr:transposase [Methylococcaceae bacterium]OYV20185.1 MAG: transposase IS3/IS911 family protein [Methylococcaceae bacterium NSP1-2]
MKRPESAYMTTETKQKYTAEYKDNAVKRANESSNVAETARELGIKPNTLYNWVYQFSQRTNPDKPERTDEHLYDELKQLRKEVARLKEERDILKKAAAYFARETR